MKRPTKTLLTAYSLSLSFILLGCGGSSTSTTTPDNTIEKSTYLVSGTVPGTLIEAFCKDGGYHSVNSTDNGTSNHPFTIELPANIDCKLIMTTNENDPDSTKHIVTPILLNDGTITSSYFQLSKDTDMGNIPLSLTGEGVQIPLTLAISDDGFQVNEFSYDPLDTDNDNIPNVYEDDDNDGITNIHDEDDDGDGIEDRLDSDNDKDSDGDGIENDYDNDDDNDGIEDSKDNDDDNDGIEDSEDNDSSNENNNNTITPTPILPISYKEDAGRLLGSQCAQCHGTNGVSVNGWDSIAGESNLLDEIFDDEPIMSAQAHGYTNEEIILIGNWLQTLSKNND